VAISRISSIMAAVLPADGYARLLGACASSSKFSTATAEMVEV